MKPKNVRKCRNMFLIFRIQGLVFVPFRSVTLITRTSAFRPVSPTLVERLYYTFKVVQGRSRTSVWHWGVCVSLQFSVCLMLWYHNSCDREIIICSMCSFLRPFLSVAISVVHIEESVVVFALITINQVRFQHGCSRAIFVRAGFA